MSGARASALRAQADALEAQARALRAEADAIDAAATVPANDARHEGAAETIAAFASRYGWSKRHVGALLTAGLPRVGEGRGVRIPSRAADAWLLARAPSSGDDGVRSAAIAAARRASR